MLSFEFCLKPSRIPKQGTNSLTIHSVMLEVSRPFPEHRVKRSEQGKHVLERLGLPVSGHLQGGERCGRGGAALTSRLMKRGPLVYNKGVLELTGSMVWGLNPAQDVCEAWVGLVPHCSPL